MKDRANSNVSNHRYHRIGKTRCGAARREAWLRAVSRSVVCLCGVAWIAAAGGCQLSGDRVVASPMSYSEQEREILTLVPIGTPREKALETLTTAGIRGEFGTNDTIYYCDLWKRDDGQQWHLNVALLFDDAGKLYKARMGQPLITAEPSEEAAKAPDAKQPQ